MTIFFTKVEIGAHLFDIMDMVAGRNAVALKNRDVMIDNVIAGFHAESREKKRACG